MRFKRSQLLKHVSQKELLAYQNEIGFSLAKFSHEEITITEMVSKLYGFYRYSGNMILFKHLEPTELLNQVDMRKRIALDISRCLVTAKKLGEDVSRCESPIGLFNFLIRDLSMQARCLSECALTARFGSAYNEAAYTLYSEVCTLIRRLMVTRQGYDSIKTIPGAVLCDSPKKVSSDTSSSEILSAKPAAETEHSVRPERAIAPLPTVVPTTDGTKQPSDRHHGSSEAVPTEDGTQQQSDRQSETVPTADRSQTSETHEFSLTEKMNEICEALRARGIDPDKAAEDGYDDFDDEIWEDEFIEPDERIKSAWPWQETHQSFEPERLNACFDRFMIGNERGIKKRV